MLFEESSVFSLPLMVSLLFFVRFRWFAPLVVGMCSLTLLGVEAVKLPLNQLKGVERLDSIGVLAPRALDEISGMVQSQKHPGYLWTHNDSGGAARLFGFPVPEAHRFAWGGEFQQLFLAGQENVDWEELMMGSDGRLYVADTGNNLKSRKSLKLLRFAEPESLHFAQVTAVETIRFRYADPEDAERTAVRDCEAICEYEGGVLLFTKRLLNSNCDVFYLPRVVGENVSDAIQSAQFLFRINPFRGVTAADSFTVDGVTTIAMLGYGLIWTWQMADSDGINQLRLRIQEGKGLRIRAGLCESLCFENAESMIITNEGRDVYRVRLDQLQNGLPSSSPFPVE